MKNILYFLLCCTIFFSLKSFSSKLTSPGLNVDIIMPARYFLINLGNNQDISSKHDLKVIINGTNKLNRPCRIWTELLDRKDNFFIVRYKLYEMCKQLQILVSHKGDVMGHTKYYNILPDDCMCPVGDVKDFLKTWNCGQIPNLLQKQLKVFGTVNWDKIRNEVIEAFNKPLSISLCHYVIKNSKIYRKCYGKYVDFKMFIDKILLSLARKTKLPDVEFFMNLGDWPLSSAEFKFPIFSWCGSKHAFDINLPTYELTESVLENMGRVSVNTLSVQGNVEGDWDGRIPKLFWRGRDSNQHRLDLIKISRKYPDLFNVSLTNFFFYKNEEEVYGPKTEHVSFYRFFDYKYQLAIDGTVSPYRMPFLLAGGSLVFKPESKYFEHFYEDLKPYVHYIPVEEDLSDLVDKIKWAQENDDEAKEIAKNGQSFVNEHLSPVYIFCYHIQVLNEFSKIIASSIKVLDGMEEVKQENLQDCDCTTHIKDEL